MKYVLLSQPVCAHTNTHSAPVLDNRRRNSSLVVRAAEEEGGEEAPKKEKKPKKAIPSPVKRAMLAKTRRLYNKSRKSACATRIKKVCGTCGVE